MTGNSYIPWICKSKFDSRTCISNQKWSNDKCRCECKKYRTCKIDYSWNPITCICENGKYLKSTVDISVNVCNRTMEAVDSVSTNVTNTIPTNMINTISTNVTSTVSINLDDEKGRYKMNCYILHTFFLVIILLLIIAVILQSLHKI